MKLAHLSDFHLGFENIRREGTQLRRLIDHALANGAEHLLFGGDIVDRANLDDARILRRHLQRRGYLHSAGFSIVPGNHDIWPISEGRLFRDLPRFALGSFGAAVTLRKNPAQRNFERFVDLFGEAFEGCRAFNGKSPLPGCKRIGPLAVGLLDTTSWEGGLRCASGRFDSRESAWLRETLHRHDGPRILIMHHWPFHWTPRCEGALERVRNKAARLGLSVPVSFNPIAPVQRFVRDSGVDAVFCGHLHMAGEDVADEAFERTIGRVPIHCMGRSGGVHQPRRARTLAYHLIDVEPHSVKVRTVYVPVNELMRESAGSPTAPAYGNGNA